MKIRILKAIIMWLWSRYPYLVMDIVLPSDAHIHRNPVRKRTNQAVMEVTG